MQRTSTKLILPAALCLGIALSDWPVRADDEAAGRVLFNYANALVSRGQLNEACPKFEESLRQSYNINAHYFLADCWERQGKTATAWTTFLRVATKAREANDERRERAAQKRADSLEARLVRLRIIVAKEVNGLEVRRNGNAVGRPMWAEVVPVDPGDIEFTASAPGFEPFKMTVTATGEGKILDVTIPELTRQAPSVTSPPPTRAATPEPVPPNVRPSALEEREGTQRGGGSPLRALGWVAGGVGFATMAAGGVVALLAKGSFDSAKTAYDGCQDAHCQDQNLQKEKSAISQANVATALVIGGGAAAAMGLVLVIAGAATSDSTSPSASLGVLPSGLSLAGRF
jgi:hypothetical protein